jgi:hypothetical protein
MRFYCEFSSLILENLDYCIVLRIFTNDSGDGLMDIKLPNNKVSTISICGCSVPSRQKKVDDNDWIDKNGIHYNDVGLKL